VERDGSTINVVARKGVLLAAGGFERNPEMRRRFSGDQPNEGQWTVANLGNTGEVLTSAMELDAKTDLLDEAWWVPAPRAELQRTTTFAVARRLPRTICVDNAGKRFVNESNSYVEFGKAQYAAHAVPCWLIFDDGYRRRYPMTRSRGTSIKAALPGRLSQEWIDKGWIRKADTLEQLAAQIDADPATLAATVRSFNEHARKGEDPEFGRGRSAYNKLMGDPGHKPNAAIGPLDRAPFYATELYPSDVGTCGGVITDEYGRVINQSDRPIPGLYATGNITATVLGRTYPGAGASIANSMAFGYAAARHAAGVNAPGPERKPTATPS
jgi:3-oxosteroid 1-dehydrogenase